MLRGGFPVLRKEIGPWTGDGSAPRPHTLPGTPVSVVETDDLDKVLAATRLVMPDEFLMRELADRADPAARERIVWRRTFLRWDREWSKPQAVESAMTEAPDGAREAMRTARLEAGESSDWWRQVGAVLRLRDGRELTGHNHHHLATTRPTSTATRATTTRAASGGPVNRCARRGVRPPAAARAGASTEGSTMFVTTFPCPACARLIAMSGVAECWFEADYADLAGEQVLGARRRPAPGDLGRLTDPQSSPGPKRIRTFAPGSGSKRCTWR